MQKPRGQETKTHPMYSSVKSKKKYEERCGEDGKVKS